LAAVAEPSVGTNIFEIIFSSFHLSPLQRACSLERHSPYGYAKHYKPKNKAM
jgi:hypothetical protein